jgi:hypothetical protein
MTCIVGWTDGQRVTLGADSASVNPRTLSIVTALQPKVFQNGPMVIGCTTSWRMRDLLAHMESPPRIGDLDRYMRTTFIDAVRATFERGGWAMKPPANSRASDDGGEFLVGIEGRLFYVGEDFHVSESAKPYAACGSGREIAIGALDVLETMGMDAESMLRRALEASAEHCAGVRPPFTFVTHGSK